MVLRAIFWASSTATAPARRQKRGVPWWLWGAIALGSWWSYQQWQAARQPAQAIFVLGGHEARERLAAKLAKQYPHLPVWVSSGSPENYVKRIFRKAGVPAQRLHLDYHAKDTVTNFTTLADRFRSQKIQSVYLVTSENHMTRAYLVGQIIFGSRGIALKPIAVPTEAESEAPEKSVRDVLRALLWLAIGRTGDSWSLSSSNKH